MNDQSQRLSTIARQAVRAKKWPAVRHCAQEIIKIDNQNAEGWFLSGLVAKNTGRTDTAVDAFSRALALDSERYDAAIELAWQYWLKVQLSESLELLRLHEQRLTNSPLYLEMAAHIYTRLGLHTDAYQLYERATNLQPEIYRFRENLARCSVIIGKIDEAQEIYKDLLEHSPAHQRNHYALSRLSRATDFNHVEQMRAVLSQSKLTPDKNIFIYYALAKELEDLEEWDEAFDYYSKAGDAASIEARKAGYRISQDTSLFDQVISDCSEDWIRKTPTPARHSLQDPVPVFIVGLPRTGTTLTERIISSHSKVESADETQFIQLAIQKAGGTRAGGSITPAAITAAAKAPIDDIAGSYMEAIRYRLSGSPWFIDKMPENFLYLGFIAKAFPQARIVHLKRHPMDACFAMFKQSFFRFAYRLEDIAEYYLAYNRLQTHWNGIIGDRMIEVSYEDLVSNTEEQTRNLLDQLGLEFESACLDFHLNAAPSATASSAQIRETTHTRSVNKWKHWEKQLEPLKRMLNQGGVLVE